MLLGCAESPGFSSYAPHGRLARSHEGCEPGRARPPGAPCLPAHPSLLLLYACSRGPSRAFPRTFPSSRSPPASLALYGPARIRASPACIHDQPPQASTAQIPAPSSPSAPFLHRPQGLPSPAHSHSEPRRRKRRRRGKQFTRPARERSERRGPPGMSDLQPAGRFNHFKPQAERSGDLICWRKRENALAPAPRPVLPYTHPRGEPRFIDLHHASQFVCRKIWTIFLFRTIGCEDCRMASPLFWFSE